MGLSTRSPSPNRILWFDGWFFEIAPYPTGVNEKIRLADILDKPFVCNLPRTGRHAVMQLSWIRAWLCPSQSASRAAKVNGLNDREALPGVMLEQLRCKIMRLREMPAGIRMPWPIAPLMLAGFRADVLKMERPIRATLATQRAQLMRSAATDTGAAAVDEDRLARRATAEHGFVWHDKMRTSRWAEWSLTGIATSLAKRGTSALTKWSHGSTVVNPD